MNLTPRVWIYQSNREFSKNEIQELSIILSEFVNLWTAHNQKLKANYEMKYDRFIVLIVDETQAGASGCSIDKSVHLMKEIESRFNVNLFDRFNIAYKVNQDVLSVTRIEFEELIREGTINSETIVFNNLVTDYKDYINNWEIPFKNSWHSKVFKLEAIL